jgi:hypothetical protein
MSSSEAGTRETKDNHLSVEPTTALSLKEFIAYARQTPPAERDYSKLGK